MKPIVDHRIYTIRPRKMGEFLDVFDRLAMPILLRALGHPLGATGAMILGTVLDELERRGLARRQAVADDRRSRALYLTEKGESLTREIRRLNAVHEERLASLLPPGKAEVLIDLLRKLIDGVGGAQDSE